LASEFGNGPIVLFLLNQGADVSLIAHSGSLNHKSMGLQGNVARRFLGDVTQRPTDAVDSYIHARRVEAEKEEMEALRELERLGLMSNEDLPDLPTLQVRDADLQQGDAEVIDEHIDDARGTCDVLESLNQESGWVSSGDEEMTWKYANVDTLPGGTFLSKVAPLRPRDLVKPPPEPALRTQLNARSEKLRGVVRRPAGTGDSALTTAARAGHADICDLLVRFGADGNAQDGNGETALCVAARFGHVDACRVLLTSHPPHNVHAAAVKAAEESGSEAAVRLLRGYEV